MGICTQDDGRLGCRRATSDSERVHGDTYLLGQFLTFAALIAATIEYAEIIKRRGITRKADAVREESADLGLRGLVRVLLAEGEQGSTTMEPPR